MAGNTAEKPRYRANKAEREAIRVRIVEFFKTHTQMDGWDVRKIAEEFGVSDGVVARVLKEMGSAQNKFCGW
jgi:AraC-like DNA-binding protein